MMRRRGKEEADYQREVANARKGSSQRARSKWKLGFFALLVSCIIVGVGVYLWRTEYYCFVWQRYWYPSLQDAAQCELIRASITKIERVAVTGFREVWEAKWQTPSDTEPRTVAYKLLYDAHDCGDVKGHFREVVMERKLSHPQIVPLIAACNVGPPQFEYVLVADFMAGGSLRDLHRQLAISTDQILSWMLDVAKALHYLHVECAEQGLGTIIHDDLNSGQVVLSADRSKAYLTDFNLAAAIPPGSRDAIRRSWWPGAPGWRFYAPEKLRLEPYYEAADLWSFAVLFYETVARVGGVENEWNRVTREHYQAHMLNRDSNHWRPKRPTVDLTDAEWGLIERCWSYDPEERPTIGQVKRDLEAFIEQRKRT